MAGVLPTSLSAHAPRSRCESGGCHACLSDNGDCPFLLHDNNHSGWSDLPSAKAEAFRSISSLAHIIAPIAGDNAGIYAEQLISRFGSIASAFEGDPASDDLTESEAEAILLLRTARNVVEAAFRESFYSQKLSARFKDLNRYLKLRLGLCADERLLVVYVDANGEFLRDEIVAEGRKSQLKIPVRRIMRRAFDLGAHGLLLAHNHPSGDATPSSHDISSTDRLRKALAPCEIGLVDHLIVSRRKVYSMRQGRFV